MALVVLTWVLFSYKEISIENDSYILSFFGISDVSEKIIAIILLAIGILYFLDILVGLFNQKESCKYDYTCKDSFSPSEYLKHTVVIFFLAFSLGVLGSLEIINKKTDEVIQIKETDKYIDNFKRCVGVYKGSHKESSKEIHKVDTNLSLNDYNPLLSCSEDLLPALVKPEDRTPATIIYVLYNIFQNVLIALIAIELTTAYFISGHNKSQSLVTGLLIAAIIDIVSFVTLKTVVAQPSLPIIEVPRYHIEIGLMLGVLSVLSFFSSFEAIQYAQIKVDHSLGRFNILKQLAEIIKNGSSRNKVEIEATLQDYSYTPRTKILTKILKEDENFNIRCEMFHDLYGYTSFFKEKHFDLIIKSLIDKGFNIKKNLRIDECISDNRCKTNAQLLKRVLNESKITSDINSLVALYYCLVNEVEVEIVLQKLKDSTNNNDEEHDATKIKYNDAHLKQLARCSLEKAGFQTNRYRHEETIELIIDYYLNSKYENKIHEDLSMDFELKN